MALGIKLARVAIIIAIFALWEALSRSGTVNPRLLPAASDTLARSYGATSAQTALRVYLPSMLPVLLEALRISMIFNLTGVILAEMYASRDGIGHQIASWGENFQMKQLLAGVVMIATIAIAFNEGVRWVETRCSHWRT